PDAVVKAEEDDIPELIQDTLPDLEILAPELATTPQPVMKASAASRPVAPKTEPAVIKPPIAAVVHEPTENELPVLTSVPAEARDEDGRVPTDIPAWDRDPTLAELRPDLEALERAMAVAHGPEAVAAASKRRRPAASDSADDVVDVIPEITLDKQIEAKIQEATEALKKAQLQAGSNTQDTADTTSEGKVEAVQPAAKPTLKQAPQPAPKPATKPETVISKPAAQPVVPAMNKPAAKPVPIVSKPAVKPVPVVNKPAAKPAQRPTQELEKIASGLARAKTIEDVDDYMAETLFGEEFSQLAAQVAANASLLHETAPEVAELKLETDEPRKPHIADSSLSQRLKVLRDLNEFSAPRSAPRGAPATPDSAESIVISAGGFDAAPADESTAVDSIEDQISTSMTQSLKALSIRPSPKADVDDTDQDDDDDDDDSGKGFFSRFRRK
ncbi:MAG: hypothetical protein OEV69_15235, partial [Gammaproteobacteria bacterium]|nr:hypothetical protein [Gammaproteobacteria bacterium]